MEPSGYLRYLPPVLWQANPDQPGFSIGELLRIFEKVLTGIDDGVTIAQPSITDQIAGVPGLLDPWKAPEQFLPWLASWVALDFPALQGQQLWDEYQRRNVTAQIALVYRRRGLKSGLASYLDLYAVDQHRPRIALDDGSRLLVTTPGQAALAPVTALVTQGPVVTAARLVTEGLVRPSCAAMSGDGHIFVGDMGITGVTSGLNLPVKNRVWRISPDGQYDLTGNPPQRQPVAAGSMPLLQVAAVAVRPAQSGAPETLYTVDQNGTLYAVQAPYLNQAATQVTVLAAAGATFWPVAMAVDVDGDLLILDRGDGPGSPNPPKILTVKIQPLTVTRTPLSTVLEPLSLLVRGDGDLVIGDGREQQPTQPGEFAGNLVRVHRGGQAQWTETLLIPTGDPAAGNPLVAPTAITQAGPDTLYVLDAGLKPFTPPGDNPFVLAVAEPAAVFRVSLSGAAPTVIRVSEPGEVVYPTGMVADGDRLVICDRGQPEAPGLLTVMSRLRPFHLNVVLHFVDGLLSSDPQQRAAEQRRVIGNVQAIVEEQRPAHIEWSLITEGPD
jgi:phage tail-like protein